jgi:hypothetical protein
MEVNTLLTQGGFLEVRSSRTALISSLMPDMSREGLSPKSPPRPEWSWPLISALPAAAEDPSLCQRIRARNPQLLGLFCNATNALATHLTQEHWRIGPHYPGRDECSEETRERRDASPTT